MYSLEGLYESFLQGVGCIIAVTEHAKDDGVHAVFVPVEQHFLRFSVISFTAFDYLRFLRIGLVIQISQLILYA